MALYRYRAIGEDSVSRTGTLRVRTEADLEQRLGMQGLTLIEAEPGGLSSLADLFHARFGDNDLLNLTYLLKLVIASGISLLTGLASMTQSYSSRRMDYVVRLILDGVESGMSLSDVMLQHPELFPHYYVQIVRVGEMSGTLEDCLDYLMKYLEWQIGLRKTIASSLTYPLIILAFMIILVAILFTFVFPPLVKIFAGLNTEPPLATRIVISLATTVRAHLAMVGGGILATAFLAAFWLKTPRGKRAYHAFVLRLPLVGTLAGKINLSRYFKQLHTLYSSGLSVERTFSTAAGSIGNLAVAEKLAGVTDAVISGQSISQALQETGFVPAFFTDMVDVGEKSGNLDSALLRITEILDKEIPETIRKVFSWLEPLTIIFLGGMVLFVLLSIFLPIYSVIGHIRVR
jgi:type II secretory pathway component PulF